MTRLHVIAVWFFLIAILISGAIIFIVQYDLFSHHTPKKKNAKTTPGSSAVPWKQSFETTIGDLMFVSLDDIEHGFISKPVDMAWRAQFFDEQGWQEYQGFVAQQKMTMRGRMIMIGPTPQSMATMDKSSRDYERIKDGDTIFTAEGRFCYGTDTDAYTCDKEIFKLRIWLGGDVQTPSIKIYGWSVQ